MSVPNKASREAIDWVIRLRHGTVEDWEAFTSWLERDPAHAPAYQAAAIADEMVEMLPDRGPATVAQEEVESRRPATGFVRRAVIGWAAAAAVAAGVGLTWMSREPTSYTIATRDGERRSLTLPDGSKVDLNGGSALELDHANGRFARLLHGEALFTVTHDADAPFRVAAGDALIVDLGTVFNVTHAGQEVSVAVAQGAVRFHHGSRRIELAEGMSLDKGAERIVTSRQSPATIGAWRQGRLIYSSAPLSRIALDLTRSTGMPFRADSGVSDRRFTGIIVIDGDREQLLRRVSALLGVGIGRSGGQLIFIAGEGETP